MSVAVALLCASCSPDDSLPSRDARADSLAMVRALESYQAAARANDLEALSSLWTDDAVYVATGMPTLRGRAAIDSLITSFHETYRVSDIRVHPEELTVSGDAAYLMGTYRETLVHVDGHTEEVEGRFMMVWRRQADGSWKIARSFGTDLPGS